MRWMLAAAAVALTTLLLLGCGSKQGVNDAIDRSTAPVLVPTGEWRRAFEFTAPPGSTDFYHLRWNFSAGATDIVNGWQLGPTASRGKASAEAGAEPGPAAQAFRAALDDRCEEVDAAAGIRLCSYPFEFARGGANVYLVRDIADRILVIEYLNIDGDRNEYNPEALGARFISATFDEVAIDGDLSDYLVYIN